MTDEFYSIYAVEHDTGDGHSHSFLLKVREGNGALSLLNVPPGGAFVGDEIHFVDAPLAPFMDAYDRRTIRKNDGTYTFNQYASGEKDFIEGLWARALSLIPAVQNREIPFAKKPELHYQFNCRSGTEAALNAMGMAYVVDKNTVRHDGLGKNLLRHLQAA